MARTRIEWTDATENFGVRGCLHACSYCYGRKLSRRINLMECARWLKSQGARGYKALQPEARMAFYRETPVWCEDCWEFRPHLHGRIEDVKLPQSPQKIFVDSMWDWCCEGNDPAWAEAILKKMEEHPQHTFQVLTKNPARYREFRFPANVWLGMTIDFRHRHASDWVHLAFRKGNIRFISFEPLLGPPKELYHLSLGLPDWIIVGAMTGAGAVQPRREWVDELLCVADEGKVPVFLKDNLLRLFPDLPRRRDFPSTGASL